MVEKKLEIPKFKNEQEEAEFWATHSTADYWNEWEPVDEVYERPDDKKEKYVVSIRLDVDDLDKLKKIAKSQGIGHTTLIRMWIKQNLSM